MTSVDWIHHSAACAAAFLAGAINSVAGGGTLISFPTLVWLGLPPVIANATNTVAIWPGSLGSLWGFRRELRQADPKMRALCVSSLLGGGIGALLLRFTPSSWFERMVPFLILFATLLFTVQGPVQKRWKGRIGSAHRVWLPGALVLQLGIAIYGGYFGAGISFLMLSGLSLSGMTDILEMNALTSLYSLCINGVAAALFIGAGMVYWTYVLPMALAAVIGGYGAAGVARRIGRTAVRRFVITAGFTFSVVLFLRTF
jgi:uncharacterized membrane protein YfcA